MSYLRRVSKAHQILHNLESRLNYQLSVSSLGCTLRQTIVNLLLAQIVESWSAYEKRYVYDGKLTCVHSALPRSK